MAEVVCVLEAFNCIGQIEVLMFLALGPNAIS